MQYESFHHQEGGPNVVWNIHKPFWRQTLFTTIAYMYLRKQQNKVPHISHTASLFSSESL